MLRSLIQTLSKSVVSITLFFFFCLVGVTLFLVSFYFESLSKKFLFEKFIKLERFWETIQVSMKDTIEVYFNRMIMSKKTIELMKRASSKNEDEKRLARAELYTHIFPVYDNLKKKHDIRQVHFFTPDSRSFLRMHSPHEYGDDLSKIRPTVVYVNVHRKAVYGFDPGYYLSGFRYVFPLFDEEGNYLGGVEISKSFHALRAKLVDLFQEFDFKLLFRQDVILSRVAPHRLSFYQPSPFGNIWLEEDPLGELSDSPSLSNPTLQAVYNELPNTTYIWEKLNSPKGGVFQFQFKDKYYVVLVLKIYDIDGKEVAALLGIGNSKLLEELENVKSSVEEIALALSLLCSVFLYLILVYAKRTAIERQKVRRLLDDAHSSAVFVDRNGRIVDFNRRFLSVFNYREEEIVQQDLHDLLHGHLKPKEECAIYKAVIEGRELTINETVFTSLGEELKVEVTVLPIVVKGSNQGSLVILKS